MYAVQTADPVLSYLAGIEGLSTAGIAALIEQYTDELGARGDHFHASQPLAHESDYFHYDTVLVEGNNLWGFEFIVNASHKAVGVLIVVYAEAELLGTKQV